MTPLVFALVALAGGVGAVCRLLLDGAIRSRLGSALPFGTIVINVTGSLLLGLVVGLATRGVLDEGLGLVLGTGFLGGYTTFSTASYETVRLVQERRYAASIAVGLGVVVLGTAAAALGLAVSSI